MTIHSVVIDVIDVIILCGFTFFNDMVIRGTLLDGNFLPFSIMGSLILLVLLGNPLLASVIAIIIGLVCYFPTGSPPKSFAILRSDSSGHTDEMDRHLPTLGQLHAGEAGRTPRRHPDGICAYWICDRISNAAMGEGFNNKIRHLIAQAYGFRDYEYLKRKIYE